MAQAEDEARAKEQAQSQLDGVKELVAELEKAAASGDDESIRETIYQDPLSVEVRSDWTLPGNDFEASEYRILLCTGGPAVQIIGDLDQHNEPETARLQYQDWFTPWVDFPTTADDARALLTYAQVFFYG